MKLGFVLILLGTIFSLCCEEHITDAGRDSLMGLQEIPSHEETAKRLRRYFLHTEARPRYQRQLASYFDVLYIIDSSSSISKVEFQRGVTAIRKLIHRSKLDSKHATVTIATRAKTFVNFTSRTDAAQKLESLTRSGGKTNTQDALELAYQMFTTSEYGVRPGSFGRVLVVTDGRSNINRHRTERKAKKVKGAGMEVFVIAVGEYLDGMDELAKMASTTYAHMYRVQDMRGLVQVVKLIPRLREQPGGTNLFGGRPLDGTQGLAKRSLLEQELG